MDFKLTILPTDALLYLLVVGIIAFIIIASRSEQWRVAWRQVWRHRLAMVALVVLLAYVIIGLLDSIHFRPALEKKSSEQVFYSIQVHSVLDVILGKISHADEVSYSAPFALYGYTKNLVEMPDGKWVRAYPRLQAAGEGIQTLAQRNYNILMLALQGSGQAGLVWLILIVLTLFYLAYRHHQSFKTTLIKILKGQSVVAWREVFLTLAIILQLIFIALSLSAHYHIFGTDKVGQDIFYAAIKSIRTGLIIGTLTTLFMLPFAILFGTLAGYFGGWLDDSIQYVYTTLSSIPGVLLITAAILSLQVYIETHADSFPTLAVRADIRLLALCAILGVTSWTTLCRLLRGETLKLREIDYIAAAKTLGTSNYKIIMKHILPNVMHIILITVVLDFSGLVLAEAVLSYVGVGVDPSTLSWGNMINSARLELAREPVVWWPLTAAFIFMFGLVLSANLFADAVRDAFDPKLRK